MGTVVRIPKKGKAEDIQKALDKLKKKNNKKGKKTIADFYGKMPNAYGDGLAYQKKLRDEWN
jgi:hypothetical protein